MCALNILIYTTLKIKNPWSFIEYCAYEKNYYLLQYKMNGPGQEFKSDKRAGPKKSAPADL